MKEKDNFKLPPIEIVHKKDQYLMVTLEHNPKPVKIKFQDDVYTYYADKYYNFAGKEYVDRFVEEILVPRLGKLGLLN